MLTSLKVAVRAHIGRHRRGPLVRQLHRVARFVEDAYDNCSPDVGAGGEAALLRRLASASPAVAFDVGANVGDWSMAALDAWPGARVHAFEVAPVTFERLRQRLASDPYGARVVLNACGLTETSGALTMFFYPEHPELTCDSARHGADKAVRFDARMLAGDEYVAAHGIGIIDFLKIDVEGVEHLVLKGFRSSLAAGRVHCIQFEYGAFAVDTRFLLADYYGLLGDRFWIGKIFPTGVEFRDYSWTLEDFRFANFLCVSKARPDLRELAAGDAAFSRHTP